MYIIHTHRNTGLAGAEYSMNERILEIAKQAGLKFPSEAALSPMEIKFAQLIVAECADIAFHSSVQAGADILNQLSPAPSNSTAGTGSAESINSTRN